MFSRPSRIIRLLIVVVAATATLVPSPGSANADVPCLLARTSAMQPVSAERDCCVKHAAAEKDSQQTAGTEPTPCKGCCPLPPCRVVMPSPTLESVVIVAECSEPLPLPTEIIPTAPAGDGIFHPPRA